LSRRKLNPRQAAATKSGHLSAKGVIQESGIAWYQTCQSRNSYSHSSGARSFSSSNRSKGYLFRALASFSMDQFISIDRVKLKHANFYFPSFQSSVKYPLGIQDKQHNTVLLEPNVGLIMDAL
jgi:hypothetical protein